MGVLSYLVVANRSDAPEVWNNFLSKRYVWEDFPQLDLYGLVELHAVLTDKKVTKKLKNEYSQLFPKLPDDADSWVYAIPDELTILLSEITNEGIAELADAWEERGGWIYAPGISIEKTKERFKKIRTMAKKAIKKKRSLLIFSSL